MTRVRRFGLLCEPDAGGVTEWLTPEEAANILKKKPKTLANWRSEGIGPEYKKPNGTILYAREKIDEWVEHSAPPKSTTEERHELKKERRRMALSLQRADRHRSNRRRHARRGRR
jgi:Helix-turn-helix domain